MPRLKTPPGEERISVTIRFDASNERWLRLRSILNNRSLAEEINVILSQLAEQNPLSIKED